MTLESYPVLPPEIAPLMDEHAFDAHEKLANTRLEDILSSVPSTVYHLGEGSAGFVEILPTEDHDPSKAVVLPLQFNRGWDKEAAIRVKLFSDMLHDPTRLIVFPNKSLHGQVPFFLTAPELRTVANGEYFPIANQYLRTLERLNVKNFGLLGGSQAAAVGASTIRAASNYFEVSPSGLIDPPNAIRRTRKQLQEDFKSTGLAGLNKAINDAGIPAYNEANYAADWDLAFQLGHLAAFALNSKTEPNRSIEDGFTVPKFAEDVNYAMSNNDLLKLLVASGLRSRVSPPDVMAQINDHLSEFEGRWRYLGVSGYGHELISNIVAFSLLGRAAIEDSAIQTPSIT